MSSCEEVSGRAVAEMREVLTLKHRAGTLHTAAEKLRNLGFAEQAESLDSLSRQIGGEAEEKREKMTETFRRLAGVCS